MRRQRGETCVTTKWTIPPRRSLKTIFAALRREPLRTQVRVVCSFDTGRTMGAKTSAAARSSALNLFCSAGVGAEAEAAAEAEPVAVPVPEPAPVPEGWLEPEPELVPEVVVTFDDTEDTAEETVDVAELVVGASDDVTLLTVETMVETTDVGFGGGGEDDVGSGTLVLVGSGTLVLVGSGTVVLVGSVGSGTVVVVRSEGGPSASAVGVATAAAAAQSRIDLAHRPLMEIQPRSRANGCG
jgi:hypothetical protein